MAATGEISPDGTAEIARLAQASDGKMRRPAKIKGEANPFDPRWRSYFEERNICKLLDSLRWQRRVRQLWLNQNGKCVVCCQPITLEMGRHKHHLVQRANAATTQLPI